MKRFAFALVVTTAILLLSPQKVSAATINISPGTSIQTTINNADADDTIHLAPGTYVESNITIDKNINIEGEDRNTTFIQPKATESDPDNGRVFLVTSFAQVSLSNITARYGATTESGANIYANQATINIIDSEISSGNATGNGGGIYANDAFVSINGCKISSNVASTGGGIYVEGDSPTWITNNSIHENTASNIGGAVNISNTDSIILFANNTVFNNSSSTGALGGNLNYVDSEVEGLYIYNNTFHTNYFTGQAQHIDFFYSGTESVNVFLKNNIFADEEAYIADTYDVGFSDFVGDIVSDFNIYDSSAHSIGIRLETGSFLAGDNDFEYSYGFVFRSTNSKYAPIGGNYVFFLDFDSPAVDAGTSIGEYIPTEDARGYERDDKVDIGAIEDARTAVHRFYNATTKAHFYTGSESQKNRVLSNYPQFEYEGIAFYTYKNDMSDYNQRVSYVYRFYNNKTGAHFYTSSEVQRDKVISNFPDFSYEGIAFYTYMYVSNPYGSAKLHRFYNETSGAHFYTASEQQRARVIKNYPEFEEEGVAFRVLPILDR